VDKGLHTLNMIEANASFRVAGAALCRVINEAAEHNKVAVKDIAWFIPHQANLRMFQAIARTLHLPMEKFYVTLHKYGNISSASCAIAFDEAVRDEASRRATLFASLFSGRADLGSALVKW